MGENEELGWFPRYTPSEPMCNDIECATQVWNGSHSPNSDDYLKVREVVAPNEIRVIPKEEFLREFRGKPHRVQAEKPHLGISYEDGIWYMVNRRTNVRTRIDNPSDFKGYGFFKDEKIARKHYKPKFTL